MSRETLLNDREKEQILAKIVKAFNENPEFAITKFFKTNDPLDKVNPIKTFPQFDYIKYLLQVYMTERLILVMKSRQMMVTWLTVAWYLWNAITKQERQYFFISKKEKDADKLVKRALFIFHHLPQELQYYYGPVSDKYCELRFEKTGSLINGVSQDSEALRMYTASGIFSDEMAFQEQAEKSWMAIRPTLDSGGQFIGVSTPNGKNFFYKLLFDIE